LSKENQGIPWWAKLVLYGGIVAGALTVVYYLVTNVFNGGINAYKDMWKQQYDALITKMANYQKSNPDGFTTAQQQNIAEEEKVLQLTTQGLANASQSLQNTLVYMTGVIIAGCAAVGISYIVITKWLGKTNGKPMTAHGAGYISIMGLADDLAMKGYPLQATRLVSSAQTMFQTTDLPFMQQTINSLNIQMSTLTGVQLLVAQQMVSTLTIEISAIPIWLATPLPLI